MEGDATTLTGEQFAALSELLRLREGSAQAAAELVLVGGSSVADAARLAGLPYPRAWQAVQRAQRGLKLARAAVLPDGHPKLLHLWPVKLLQAGQGGL